ncbi:MAG: hypothetical protein ACR2G6_13450 [Gemmatimonadaceae bacterium]
MSQRTIRRKLTPRFLLWLDRYLGSWRVGVHEFVISRNASGWLVGRDIAGKRVPLAKIIRKGTRSESRVDPFTLGRPPSLSARPVVVSQKLMDSWMVETERERFRGALRLSEGREKILELIERRIREKEEEQKRLGYLTRWADTLGRTTLPGGDRRLLEDLLTEHESGRREEPYEIPAAFVFRAVRHLEATGKPLLEHRYKGYAQTFLAFKQEREYELIIEDYEMDFATWRELAEWSGDTVEEVLDRHGNDGYYGDEILGPDDKIPEGFFPLQYYSPTTRVFYELDKLFLPDLFTSRGWDIDLGELSFDDGPAPGNSYVGVSVTSELGLSCLQYMLDDLRSGIRILTHEF